MPSRYEYPFQPIRNSTEPSFETTLGTTTQYYAIESTATGRQWQGPDGRSIRIVSKTGDDFYIQFGTTLAVAVSSGSMLVLGGQDNVFNILPKDTHFAIASSTSVAVNVTLGYGHL